MRFATSLRVGPVAFRIGSAWRAPIAALEDVYRDYPAPADGVADYTVRLEPVAPWRRHLRPSIRLAGDHVLPDAAPLPLAHGLLAAEMAMNLQVALGQRRFLLLHAATVERDGRAVVMTGESGAGKSTLSALLMLGGWRFLGDEFALIDLVTGCVHPFPRAISLKNAAVEVVAAFAPAARMGPWLRATPKGDIRHLIPDAAAIAGMDDSAEVAAILFPQFGAQVARRDVGAAEVFARLTQASTNYALLGEPGFDALLRLSRDVPALAIDYPDTVSALALVDAIGRGA